MPVEATQPTQKDTVLPGLNIPKEPQTFQFRIVGEIEREIYERLLGYRITVDEIVDPQTKLKKKVIHKEKVYEQLVTEWGANRIITLIYQFINEQTPFAHITAETVIKMTNIFLKQLNADIYKNFEKYITEKNRTLTMWRLLLTTVGFIVLLVLSRGIEGRESLMYYNQQRIGITGVLPTGVPGQQVVTR